MDSAHWITIANLVKLYGWRLGAEVGVHKAGTLAKYLVACPKLRMYAVDHWTRPAIKQQALDRLKRAKVLDRVIVVHAESVEGAKQVADGSLDFVFIDADHKEASVIADINAWRWKVRNGGKLCGHDVDHPPVAAALVATGVRYKVLPNNVWLER